MRAAAIQIPAGPDPAAARRRAAELVRRAAAEGAGLVVLPEKWIAFGAPEVLQAAAEPLDGPTRLWAGELAAELRIDLVAGSIDERRPGHERLANTLLHLGPDGELKAAYRKLHLFDAEVDGRRYGESEAEEPGEEVVVSALAGGAGLGLAVCYDLRFGALWDALRAEGARVVVLPSAFTPRTTADHWEVLLRARAIEQQVFVVAANQPAPHGGGCSMVVDPWGRVLAQAGDGEAVVAADLDFAAQDDVRARLPVLAHRRPLAGAVA